jgi:hypothetical protein
MKRRYCLRMAVAAATLLTGILLAQPPGRARIGRVVDDCAARTSEFRMSLRRALDHSRLDGTAREDELNAQAARLERNMQRVAEDWNGYHDARRTRAHVSRALDAAQDINRTMVRRRLNPNVQDQWRTVRRELNHLAEVFDLPRIQW